MKELLDSLTVTEVGIIVLAFIIGFSAISYFLRPKAAHRSKKTDNDEQVTLPAGKNWWDILEVSQFASEDNIRVAYQQRLSECDAARYLGDSSKMNADMAVQKVPIIQEAFRQAIAQTRS